MMMVFFEVYVAALTVGQDAVLKDLQQDVEHIRVSFLDLIEQNHTVRIAAHLFRELAALFVANISRRRTDHTGNGVLLHVFGHIDTDQRVLVAEHRLGQCLAQLGLADAGRTEEQERTDRALRVAQADTAAADGLWKPR